jgi:hypothetical protein
MGNASALAGLLLLFGATTASPANAQATADGAYAKLSTGNAKIARALFDAQVKTPSSAKLLTLDQLAAQKQGGQSWGQIFQSMKTQGLVQDKNLGQVVTRAQQQQQPRATAEASASLAHTSDPVTTK